MDLNNYKFDNVSNDTETTSKDISEGAEINEAPRVVTENDFIDSAFTPTESDDSLVKSEPLGKGQTTLDDILDKASKQETPEQENSEQENSEQEATGDEAKAEGADLGGDLEEGALNIPHPKKANNSDSEGDGKVVDERNVEDAIENNAQASAVDNVQSQAVEEKEKDPLDKWNFNAKGPRPEPKKPFLKQTSREKAVGLGKMAIKMALLGILLGNPLLAIAGVLSIKYNSQIKTACSIINYKPTLIPLLEDRK